MAHLEAPEEIKIRIYDYREYATWGIEPGFYWALGVDEDGQEVEEGHEAMIVGPFDEHEDALAEATAFIQDALTGAAEVIMQNAA